MCGSFRTKADEELVKSVQVGMIKEGFWEEVAQSGRK